jgi:RHS repeat-associated protein
VRYTGQSEQAEIGLYYYRARWCDAALGRFAQADTIVPGVGSSAAHDRYAHTYGNPVKFTDPSGHGICLGDDCSVMYSLVLLSLPRFANRSAATSEMFAEGGSQSIADLRG